MPRFVKSSVIDAPIHVVFGFHEREDALPLLTPRFPPARVLSRRGGIEKGAEVVLQVGPFRWVAKHTDYVRNKLFVDEQVSGPFAYWAHRHEFSDEAGRTRLTDNVEFRIPGGTLANAIFGWMPKLGLAQMFAHRHRVTKQYCERGQ